MAALIICIIITYTIYIWNSKRPVAITPERHKEICRRNRAYWDNDSWAADRRRIFGED